MIDQWVIKSIMRDDGETRATSLRQLARALDVEQEIEAQCQPGQPEAPTVQGLLVVVMDSFKERVARIEAYFEGNQLFAVDAPEASVRNSGGEDES